MKDRHYIDLNRAVIEVLGDDAHKFLQGMVSNDVSQATEKNAIYTYLLTPQGKYLFDLFIIKKDTGFLLDVSANDKDDILKKMKMYKLRSNVEIKDMSATHAVYAIMGDRSEGHADPRSDNLMHRIILEKNKVSRESLADINYYHKLRIDNNIPEGEYDLEKDKSYPLHYRMIELHGVDFKKGCYVGQEVTARTHHRGVIRKSVFRIVAPFELDNHKGREIQSSGNNVGKVLSAAGKEALALIEIEVAQNPQAELNILEFPVNIVQ